MAAGQDQKISVWVWLALAVLVLLALAVVFVLPRVVQQYELPLVQRTVPTPVTAVDPTPLPSGPAISPFEEAQLARQRREAQDVLAELLRRQTDLDAYDVIEWAAEPYEAAIAAARRGDTHYRAGEFAQAAEAYREGDSLLADIQESRMALFEQLMQEGDQALAESDADTALARFSLASLVDPTSYAADQGVRRARVLEEVEALLSDARSLQQNMQLEVAGDRIEQALQLDPEHPGASSLRADNEQRKQDRAFATVMSEGFDHLQRGEPEAAIAAFERALRMRPGSTEATTAIAQTREQLTLGAIAAIRQRSAVEEAEERWADAIATYREALALDANLVFAQEGLDYAERRQQLDDLLELNLQNPVRLSDQAAHAEALEVFRIASDLARDLERDDGRVSPRLASQLERTEELLNHMQVPVPLTLISDNQTVVTIYQVGQLGTFNETSVELRPGRYVAVGTRPGYRDVREEFVVGFGSGRESVTIRCHEQVAANSR